MANSSMNPQKGDAPAPASLEAEKLESWKEIAAYLGKGVTTVRRWEREEGLPVRRQEHIKRGSVLAYRPELDEWRRTRTTDLAPPTSRWRIARIALFAVAAAAIVVTGTAWTSRDGWNPTSELLHLTAYPTDEGDLSFAPGGQRFAFASVDRVMVKEVGVEPPREILRMPGSAVCCLAWSPDGGKIAFSHSPNSADWRITVLDPNGLILRRLSPGGPRVAWTPGGKTLLYAHRPEGNPTSAIYEYDFSTSGIRQVSFPPAGSWGDIAVSVDESGRRLALARYLRISRGDVYVADMGSREAVRLTHVQNWINAVDWLPHGGGIVFDAYVKGHNGLHRIASDGAGGPTLIRGTEGVNRGAGAVSTGASSIRIGFVHEFWDTNVKALNRFTGRDVPVAFSTQSEEYPDISADGRIVFLSSRSGAENLWVCSPGCQDLRRITNLHERQFDLSPAWSPDGRKIAFTSASEGRAQLIVIGAGGEDPRVVSSGSGEAMAAWSGDGRFLYFQSDRSGRPEIWRAPLAGGEPPQQITRDGGEEAHESADGREIFLTRTAEKATIYRHSLASGVESPIKDIPPVRRASWRPVGNTILYWNERSWENPTLHEYNLISGQTKLIPTPAAAKAIMGLSANAQGDIVWGESGTVHRDLQAVDLTFPSFWKRF